MSRSDALRVVRTERRPKVALRPSRTDPSFAWARNRGVDAWCDALAEWTENHGSRKAAIMAGNVVLDYLSANPSTPRTPELFCRRGTVVSPGLSETVAQRRQGESHSHNALYAFFGWYINSKLSGEDDDGLPIPSPEHRNPLARQTANDSRTETYRPALPTRLLRELYALLTENDWRWARSQKRDQVSVRDAVTGETQMVWCPVRAYALALKLLLPLRTMQVRLLESGEGDTECYRDGTWLTNAGPHAPQRSRRCRRGFLRRLESEQGETTGFFINTNKSNDRLADGTEPGFEIPWPHEQVIALATSLEQWQSRYNPVEGPLAWRDVIELAQATHPRAGGAYFLFRDPLGTQFNQPLTDPSLRALWVRLLHAMELRFHERGETAPGGSRIQLTRKKLHGRQIKRVARYDLHSLRVSMLTHLAMDGGVPLHILSKCIAGHATLLMTLYYVKIDPDAMKREMAEATERLDRTSQESFARFLRSEALKEGAVVFNDPVGYQALTANADVPLALTHTGICPINGQGCEQGGPQLVRGRYGPTPGGPKNCIRCRFHLTGPAFLGGLVSHFNCISVRVDQLKQSQTLLEQSLKEAENRRFDAQQLGETYDDGDVHRAQSRLDTAEAQLQAETANLVATYRLITRCNEIAEQNPGNSTFVVAGTQSRLVADIQECSRLELWDAVCRTAGNVLTNDEQLAFLQRNRVLDRLLRQLNHPQLLVDVSEPEAMARGTHLMRLLRSQLGKHIALLGVTPVLDEEAMARLQDALREQPLEGASGQCPKTGMLEGERS